MKSFTTFAKPVNEAPLPGKLVWTEHQGDYYADSSRNNVHYCVSDIGLNGKRSGLWYISVSGMDQSGRIGKKYNTAQEAMAAAEKIPCLVEASQWDIKHKDQGRTAGSVTFSATVDCRYGHTSTVTDKDPSRRFVVDVYNGIADKADLFIGWECKKCRGAGSNPYNIADITTKVGLAAMRELHESKNAAFLKEATVTLDSAQKDSLKTLLRTATNDLFRGFGDPYEVLEYVFQQGYQTGPTAGGDLDTASNNKAVTTYLTKLALAVNPIKRKRDKIPPFIEKAFKAGVVYSTAPADIATLKEAAVDKTLQPDDTGYTSGQRGQGMIVGKPPGINAFRARCTYYHDHTLSSYGDSEAKLTLHAFKKTGLLSVVWECPTCKAQNRTPYTNQAQIGNWLAGGRVVVR